MTIRYVFNLVRIIVPINTTISCSKVKQHVNYIIIPWDGRVVVADMVQGEVDSYKLFHFNCHYTLTTEVWNFNYEVLVVRSSSHSILYALVITLKSVCTVNVYKFHEVMSSS